MWPNTRPESDGTLKYWYLDLYEAHTRHQVTEQSPRAFMISIIIFVIYNPPPKKKRTKTNDAKKNPERVRIIIGKISIFQRPKILTCFVGCYISWCGNSKDKTTHFNISYSLKPIWVYNISFGWFIRFLDWYKWLFNHP